MANEIGVKIKLDGAPEFTSNMKEMAAQTKEFKAQLDMATSSFDKHTSAYTKSKAQTEAYKNQLSALKNEQAAVADQIDKVSNSENTNQTYVTNLKAKYAELQTQINQTQDKLNSLGGTLGAIGSQMQEVGGKISSFGSGMSKVGGALTATVTTPIVGLGTAAVKSFGDVDKQFRLVEQTMGDSNNTTEDFNNLWETMSKDASNSVYTMQDSADALLNFARQGFNAKESADMLNPALSLAAGTGTDLSTVTSGLGNALKAFGGNASDAADYADVLAKAQAQANTDTTNLFDAMSVAAPICKTVGWNIKDLATITDIFGDAGISGSEGANALKTGLARLAAPASDGAKYMDALGLSTGKTYAIFDDNGSMKDMQTVLKNLNGAFSGLNDQEKLSAASAIFGKNQMAKWLTLIDTAPETVNNYRSSLDDCTGSADKMADALMSGVGGSIEKLKSTFDVFKTTIGKDISEPVQGALDNITDLMNGFMGLDEEQRKQIEKWAAIAAAIGPVLVINGKLITGIGNTITALGTITSSIGTAIIKFGGLGSAIGAGLTSPLGIAVVSIGAGIAAFAGINAAIDATDPYIEQYKSEMSGLKNETDSAKSATETLGNTIKSQADSVQSSTGEMEAWKQKLNECFNSQGQLKSGCEATAQYILGQLNEAMGTSYSISAQGFIQNTDGAKVSLEQLNTEIDKSIEAMKRQAIQQAVSSDYADALTAQREAQSALTDAVNAYNDALEGGSKHLGEYANNVANAANALGSANETVGGLDETMNMLADTTNYSAQQCENSFSSIANSAQFAGNAAALEAQVAVGAATDTWTGWNEGANQIEIANGRVVSSTQSVENEVQNASNTIPTGWEKIPEAAENGASRYKTSADSINSDTKGMDSQIQSASQSIPAGWEKIPQASEQGANRYKAATGNVNSDTSQMESKVTSSSSQIASKISTDSSQIGSKIDSTSSNASSKVSGAASKMASDVNSAQGKISGDVNTAKRNVDSGVNSMQSKINNAHFSFPHIRLPHFSVSGSFSLDPPSVPHFDVSWYAKAMNAGMLLNNPTIFGMMGGKLLGAGEAGPEVVVGAHSLSQMVTNAVTAANGGENQRPVYITVYGAVGQSEEELADIVAEKINGDVRSKEAVFA